MSTSDTPTVTQIIYKKTSCYFCNEWLDNESFKSHLTSCGQILEKCPNNCSAFVQRKMIDNHLKDCPKMKASTSKSENNFDSIEFEQRICILEKDIITLRSALNEEIRQRNRLIADVGVVRRHNQVTNEWTLKVGDVLSALKKCLNEETQSRCIDMRQCKIDVDRLTEQYRHFEEMRLNILMRLDSIEKEFVANDNIMAHIDVLSSDARISARKICNLEDNLQNFKLLLAEKKVDSSNTNGLLMEKLSVVDNILEDHHVAMSTASQDNTKQLTKLQSKLDSFQIALSDLNKKFATLDFETKSANHIATGTEDKCDKLEKFVNETKQITYRLKQKFNDLEVHLVQQKIVTAIENTNGHLIWRIDEYAMKMAEAKQNDITLRSPLFCNKQYGYTLRLDVNLNGIGTWKGRNVIACITVVPGEWDPLLSWPCILQADIILRDQPDKIEEAKDYAKTIVVKKKNEAFEQNQYIHISHKTITSGHYLRNDAIFFEVKINS